jgi:hypothetical protein
MSQQTYEKINRSLALSMQQQKFQLAKALHDNVAIRAENQRLLCRIRQLEAVDDEARFALLLNETVEVSSALVASAAASLCVFKKELQRIRESVAEVVAIIGDNTERLSALFDKRQKVPTPNRTSVLSQLRRSRRKTNGGGDALMPSWFLFTFISYSLIRLCFLWIRCPYLEKLYLSDRIYSQKSIPDLSVLSDIRLVSRFGTEPSP